MQWHFQLVVITEDKILHQNVIGIEGKTENNLLLKK